MAEDMVSRLGLDLFSGGSGDMLIYGIIIVAFAAVAFMIYALLKGRGKTYKTTIWEYVGDSVRKYNDTIIEKEDKDKTVMFKLKRAKQRIAVTMKDATVTSAGKATFDLMKVEDQYYPMRPSKVVRVPLKDDKGKVKKDEDGKILYENIDLVEFNARFKFKEIQAAAHKIGQDSKIYTFWEKNQQIMQFIATMASIMIPFVLMLIVIMKIGPVLTGLTQVSLSVGDLVSRFDRIAMALEIIAQGLGSITPPLG